jgi:hypothetical protein
LKGSIRLYKDFVAVLVFVKGLIGLLKGLSFFLRFES